MTDPDQSDGPPHAHQPAPDVERGGIILTALPTVMPANAVFTRTELAERLLAIQLRVERETREQRVPSWEEELADTTDPLDGHGRPLTEEQLWSQLQHTMWPRGRTITQHFTCLNCATCNRVLLGPSCECVRTEAQLQGLVLARLLPPPARTFRGRPICDDCLEAV